jgi:cyclopropane-fatty-acyl-phospholipid synthase
MKLGGIKMNGFWNRLGDKYLNGIVEGTLEVTYNDGTIISYGNGKSPKADLQLNNGAFFKRLSLYGDIGFAESYMDGDFETSDLTALIKLALINSKTLATKSEDSSSTKLVNLMPQLNKVKHWMRKNSKTQSQKNISEHYDLSNDFFKLMLDDTMMYSSAVFDKPEDTLHQAQQ